ncbi:hypothetical protein [Aureliella helgolandensis]|uniref:Uncharacterized protein n=1 Tax=Aureliella helgolandensis TaxID=2527968 RepID=A0A518FZV1_9BACT|nr:hypothetical protein [Aureliella helgolandensis]QDV21861.1 hypothetical protein Q31a_01400 [Aureliella helgolandensis]
MWSSPADSKAALGDSFTERPITSALSGCIYAAFVILVSSGMMLVNALFCLTIYSSLPSLGSPAISQRIGQLFYFIMPVALMIIEWNSIDRLTRLFHHEDTTQKDPHD